MKILFLTIALLFCFNITAQELPKKSQFFVRVYDSSGEKIGKGKMLEITDTALRLKKGDRSIQIPLSNISYIKSKKTNGHNVLIGAIGGSVLGVAVVSGSSSGSGGGLGVAASKGIRIIAAILLPALGSGIGYLTTIFKKSTHYSIDGNPIKWQGFKETMYAPLN